MTTEISTVVTPQSRLLAAQGLIEALKPAIQNNYVARIGQRNYIMVAGAQALASSMGYTVRVTSCTHKEAVGTNIGHWESIAVVVDTNTGAVIGEGYGHVFDNEQPWCNRPQFAQAAMCQTRATGRALKGCIGWMFALVGAEGSFLEEMPSQGEVATQSVAALPAPITVGAMNAAVARQEQKDQQVAPPTKRFDNLPDDGTGEFTPVSAEVMKSGSGKYGEWQLVVLKTVEGPQFATLNKRIAQIARDLCGSATPRCRVTWKRTSKGGLDMIALEAVEPPSATQTADTDLPF